MQSRLSFLAAALALPTMVAIAQPARAEVMARDERGFVIRQTVEVKAPVADVWRTLVKPATWWSSEHTFSGEAFNLTLDPVPGGCFCEKLAGARDATPGGVQHMRVVYVEPGRALRLTGALGPLQSEALLGTLTVTLKASDRGTRILFEYVVGGYMRYRTEQIAPAVDRMFAQQATRLADKLGGAIAGTAPALDSAPQAGGAGEGGDTTPAPAPAVAPRVRAAPQGPSLDPDGAPISGRSTLRPLPGLPLGTGLRQPPARNAGAGLSVPDEATTDLPRPQRPVAPVARPVAAGASGVGKAPAKPAAAKTVPAKAPVPKPVAPKPAPAKLAPAKPATAPARVTADGSNEVAAQRDAQAAFDAALGGP